MGRLTLLALLALGCSASGESADQFRERDPSLTEAGTNSGGSSAGLSPVEAGSGGSETVGGAHSSAGASTMPVAGSGGVTTSTAGTKSGGSSAGQPGGGTSTTEPNPYPSCGDGVCSQTDYGISGQSYVRPETAACAADCPQTCGNQKCEALQDMWNGCYEAECTPKPPEPILVCPFPEWTWDSSANKDFVNPYRTGAFNWDPGNRVHRALDRCYQCIAYGCGGDPLGFGATDWKLIACEC